MVVVFAAVVAAVSVLSHFQLSDTYRIVGLSSPRISSDGKLLTFVRSRVNLATDKRNGELMLLDVATGKDRVLAGGRPNGRRSAMVAARRKNRLSRTTRRRRRSCGLLVQPMAVWHKLRPHRRASINMVATRRYGDSIHHGRCGA